MPQPYLRPILEIDILRFNYGVFRDDNFNIAWSADAGVTATTDGDILSLSGTTGANGFNKTLPAISTTTSPYVVVRAKGSGNLTCSVVEGASTDTFVMALTSSYQVFMFTLTSGRTTSSVKFGNQSVAGTNNVDYVAICNLTPVVLTKQDVDPIVANCSTNTVNDVSFALRNTGGRYLVTTPLHLNDILYVYNGYIQDDTQTKSLNKVFGGTITELSPDLSARGDVIKLHCQGWAQALLNAYSLKEYGSQSINNSINTMTGAVSDIITVVNAGGYQLTTNYIQSFANNALTYIIFKTEPAFNCIKQLCDLLTSNNDPSGTSTQPVEFWVDNAENCHLAALGAWGTDPNPSTYPNALNVGRDQISNALTSDIQHLVNQVHFWSITVKPPDGDAWTETTPIGNWAFSSGATGGTRTGPLYDVGAGNFRVGAQSVTASWTGATTGSLEADIRFTAVGGLDVTKLGGRIVPPRLKIYLKCDTNPSGTVAKMYAPQIKCWTTYATDGFLSEPLPLGVAGAGPSNPKNAVTNTEWHLWEYNLGPYGDQFVKTGSPNWNNINVIEFGFQFVEAKTSGQVWIDGFRIDGQTHYIAKNSTKIASYGLRESHLVNHKIREPSELQLLAKAELFRSQRAVLRGTITVPGIPDVLPGQKVTVTAPSANLTVATLRILEARHRFGTGEGFVTELDLTDDLTNYQALTPVSLSNMLLDMPTSKTQKRRDEYNIGLEKPDPTNVATIVDYPS
ncbi:MAG TPA: hypothetical protein VFE98_02880 [Candidatus Bathyarchaeia archaeon]|nr:hypothetical protein [Candidatus Bathyarchaeia archaeon]